MKEKMTETFNQLAGVYENSVDATSLFNSEYERPAMMSLIPSDLSGMTVLDAGCAAGWYTEQLTSRGAEVIATDISPEMVQSAKRRVGSQAKVLCLDLEKELPFKMDSFDLIVCSLTLHYIKDWETTFQEFRRILKPAGIFVFSIHHPFTDINWSENPHYFSKQLIIDQWSKEGKTYEVPFYRRPLGEIINKTSSYFSIEKMVEPLPTQRFKEQSLKSYERLMKKPQFLIIKSRK